MSLEMDSIIRHQTELMGRISRAGENLKKTAASKITVGVLESRIKTLENNWVKFEANHDELRSNFWDKVGNADYVKEDYFGFTEETYLEQRGAFLDQLQALRKATPAPVATPEGAVHTRRALPRIQLPHFSGSYEEWPSFRDLFLSLVDKEPSLATVEKLHYLRSSVKGEAELLIKNLQITEGNYRRSWTTLTDHYDNKRLIVRSCISAFISQARMKNESVSDLRRIYHSMLHTVNSLQSINRPVCNSDDLFVHMVIEMLDSRSRREWETAISGTSAPPSFEDLKTFLEKRVRTLEALQPSKSEPTESPASKPGGNSKRSVQTHLTTKQGKEKDRCALCHKDHFVLFCSDFKKKTPKERRSLIEEQRLCFNCLGNHQVSACKSHKSCAACGKRHHSTIHDACGYQPDSTASVTSLHVKHKLENQRGVLLATARVGVTDQGGAQHVVRALVDPGSEVSLIKEALVQRLRLPRSKAAVSILGVGGHKHQVARGQTTVTLSSLNSDFSTRVYALILPQISAINNRTTNAVTSWSHLQGLQLADPDFQNQDPVELLLGADMSASIMLDGLRKDGPQKPIAQLTTLGWIISGGIGETTIATPVASLQCRVETELNELVKRFWEQEELPGPPAPPTEMERYCEEHFTTTHTRTPEGRYTVRLPTKAALPPLHESRRIAVRVQHSVERRLKLNQDLEQKYKTFMHEYETIAHMSPADPVDPTLKRVCYLPHHGVLKQADGKEKIRVVFNGSALLSNGESLNANLLPGPNLLPALADVLTRWRLHRYAMATDIEKMYRQILVHPDDRDLQRVLWRAKDNEELREYRLNTVTYGLSCAPYLAIRTLKQLANDEQHRFPRGSEVLRRDLYVDDALTGGATLDEAEEIQRQLIELCTAGGFPLRKWSANTTQLLATIPDEHRQTKPGCAWEFDEGHSTLGLQWHPGSDAFSVRVHALEANNATKRTILAQTARLFDPLGWLAPVIIGAKILIQSTWLQELEWDQPLKATDEQIWRRIRDELPALERIRIPRWIDALQPYDDLEMHGFADASERAFAAVVYLRTVRGHGKAQVALLTAKSKVTPTRPVSLPRLELCAATLLANLVRKVQATTGLTQIRTTLWSDSTVTLAWIRGHPSRWKTYVANRVTTIQQALPASQWRHLPGHENPADCASRGLFPKEFLNHDLWWNGPRWLTDSRVEPPPHLDDCVENIPEQRTRVHISATEPVWEPYAVAPSFTDCSASRRGAGGGEVPLTGGNKGQLQAHC